MYCILNSNIALRSWLKSPYAFYWRLNPFAIRLKKEEYELLKKCDGLTEIEDSELLDELIERELCEPCEKGARTLTEWQDKTYSNRYFPRMNWMITGKCNYNCRHCFNAADNAPLMSEWSLEEANRLLDQARDCGINAFTITGGEPMLHRNFFDIVEGIYARDMFVEELNTNGYFINQESLDRMKALGCKPLIKISFDGIGWHDWMRKREGAEKDALRAIELCIKNGFSVKVQTNVNRKNLDSMLKTVELFDKMGVGETRIIRTTEAPRWVQNAGDATLTIEEYYNASLELWQKYAAAEHQMTITIWQFGELNPIYKTYTLAAISACKGKYRAGTPVCPGNRGMIAVAANGNVFPCHQMSGYYEQHGDILGNLKTGSLKDLLSGGRYIDEVCATVGDLREINPTCGGCKYFENCTGGCRAIALALTGNKMGVDPSKCIFWHGGYYERIIGAMPEDYTNTDEI